jgi:DNA-binding transcriptional LysR family regulator
MLDVTRLRVLVAVARYGSVTAAAKALNYAQPSVSHHLARLEAETGVKLIQRAGRGIRLTDAGRLLAERGAEVIGRLDAAENELAAYTGLRSGRLRLAAFPSALGTIVPAAAALLREHQPSVDLRLTEAEPPEALRMLRAGYVDVALVFRYSAQAPEVTEDQEGAGDQSAAEAPGELGRHGELKGHGGLGGRGELKGHGELGGHGELKGHGELGGHGGHGAGGPGADFYGGVNPADDDVAIDITEGVRERLLLEEPVYLVTSGHDTEAASAGLSRYARHRWIAGCDRCRAHLLRQCALAGFTPKIAFTTDDYVAVQALVAAELGISTLPALCLRAARHPGVKTVPLPGTRRYVFAVRYGDPPDPPAVQLLMDVLRTAAVPALRTFGNLAEEAVGLQLPGAAG